MFALYAVYQDGSERRLVGFTSEASAIKFNDGAIDAIRTEIRKEA